MATNSGSKFSAGPLPLLAVVGFVTVVATLLVTAHLWVFGGDLEASPRHLTALLGVPLHALILVGTWGALRYEGVSLTDVGVDRTRILPGAAAFAAFLATVTLAGIGYLVATSGTAELGFSYSMPWYWVPVWFVLTLTISNGLTEEFVFRGYAQSKCIAAARPRLGRLSPAAGIVAAGVLFGVPHVPRGLLLEGASVAAIPWILLENLVGGGIVFGVLYYLTRNVWFVGFVHGWANSVPVVMPFDPGAVPYFTPMAIVVGLAVALGYRYRANDDGGVDATRPPAASGRS
jgi:membrane protease YdiL (CAAX protease family)